ncbi:MAG: FAD-dependent oxidoreductase [Gammaproteobacteria bacterium]|nr:FAD-dependent oxidoreductase [Gammaproteobacteria bacterium]
MVSTVIIGAGHAGAQMAGALRDAGYESAIYLISADPDWPYHKPPLSKSYMKAPDAPLQPLRAEAYFEQKNIDFRLGVMVTQIDTVANAVQLDDGTRLTYEHLVIATGTVARQLSVEGHDLAGVYTLRTAKDARKIRDALPDVKRAVIIGGGFIGLEGAAMLRGIGVEVDVVELAPRLLGRAVSEPLSQAVADYLSSEGVNLHLGVSLSSIEGVDGKVRAVNLGDQTLEADLVLVGVGALPVTELAEQAGLALDNGIKVDTLLRSSVPNVYAIGDCASFPFMGHTQFRLESVQNATDQARALAKTLTGEDTPYMATPWFWSDIGAAKIQIVGLALQSDNEVVNRGDDGAVKSVYRFDGDSLVAVETINAGPEHMLARRILADGVQLDKSVYASGDPKVIKTAMAAQK